MDHIELSFCIPTYNRASSVCRLVADILSCRDSGIEVVVLDNGSTDDSLSLLQAIKMKDCRFTVTVRTEEPYSTWLMF